MVFHFETPFIDAGSVNDSQLMFLTCVYAVVLFQASGLIATGSELLMLIPSIAGLVGSVILPILGAVPDGVMVLFSGLGANAQETVAVGVGALAGSTVMLLTFPWFISIMVGRVPVFSGSAEFSKKGQSMTLRGSGISYASSLKKNAWIMMATSILFLIIQIPATREELEAASTREQAANEKQFAQIGLVACGVAFAGYLIYCFCDATEDKQLAKVIQGIETKQISIGTALGFIMSTSSKASLLQKKEHDRLKKICWPFFKRYDFNRDNTLTIPELKPLMADLGYKTTESRLLQVLGEQDLNGDGKVNFEEFVDYLFNFMQDSTKMSRAPSKLEELQKNTKEEENEDEEAEEEEMPTDLAQLSPKQQKCRIIFRSCWMMALGTLMVLIFSDPMVDALSEWGKRLDISPFYVSFVLAPLASNASELISAHSYASKRTQKCITTSLTTLVGAACMNNTFVLSIFLALVYYRGLAWQFTAETISMIVVQWTVGLLCVMSKVQGVAHAVFILAMYPGCLFLVYSLNAIGID